MVVVECAREKMRCKWTSAGNPRSFLKSAFHVTMTPAEISVTGCLRHTPHFPPEADVAIADSSWLLCDGVSHLSNSASRSIWYPLRSGTTIQRFVG
jgi:hypothetical protein